MIFDDVVYGKIESNNVSPSEVELSARLNAKVKLSDYKEYIDKVNEVASYKFAYVRLPVSISGDICSFEFASVVSNSLSRVLNGCSDVIFLAVSAGVEVDRLIARSSINCKADAFIFDAIGSAMVEACADIITDKIACDIPCTRRFSPGYADFPIGFQKQLLSRLNADKTVGISLSTNNLMIPMKSITALIGIL